MSRGFIWCLFLWPCVALTAEQPAISLRGNAAQGGMMVGMIDRIDKNTKIFLDGAPIPLLPSGQFVIGFGRDHRAQAVLEVVQPDGTAQRQTLTIRQRQYDIQRIDGIEEDKVTPPPEAWPQIRREGQQKRQARVKTRALSGFAKKFVWPISGQISGVYGSQRVLNGQPRRPHYGIDITAPANTKIIAPADGIVTLAGPEFYFEGGLIFIDHGLGLSSAFLHLGRISVRVGQEVRQGETIGFVGSTGRSTGAHLDWRIKWRRYNLDPALAASQTNCPSGAFVSRATSICDETRASDRALP